jgi:signal recognition particle subunit SRP54
MLSGSDEEGSLRMKRMIFITDSMTAAELDSDGSLFMEFGKDSKPVGLTWRVTRVAKGSGTSVREVEELLCQYRMMANMAKQAGGKNGWYVTAFDLGSCIQSISHVLLCCQAASNAENASSSWRSGSRR